jgi:5'(3')-deoxyribonucleotidase
MIIDDEKVDLHNLQIIKNNLRDSKMLDIAFSDTWQTIFCDVDEVVAPLVPKWIALAIQDGLVSPDFGSIEKIISRPSYSIIEWLGLNKQEEDKFWSFYNEEFYDDLFPTAFGRGLLKHNNNRPTKLIFVTHTHPPTEKSKTNWLNKYFPGSKVVHVPFGKSKSDVIISESPEYSTFIDDRPDLIADAVVNTRSYGKEFIMPAFGYNEDIGPVLKKAIELELVEVSRFVHTY